MEGFDVSIETIGVDEAMRAMPQFGEIAADEFTDALKKSMLLGERETKKVSPVLHGRLRSAIAGRVTAGAMSMGGSRMDSSIGGMVEGILAANIGSSGASYPYGWLLDKGSYEAKSGKVVTLHYRRGPRAGNPTAGWFKDTLAEKSEAFGKYYRAAVRRIRERLQGLMK